jgi:hydrogenase-4 component H
MVLKMLREVFRVGEATLPYPFAPIEVAPGFRGRPQHDPELCIACAACTIACPSNALRMDTDTDRGIRTWSICYGRCIYCARCEEVCPTGAITLSPDFELAVFNREDLMAKADYRLAACRNCGAYFAPIKELEYVLLC